MLFCIQWHMWNILLLSQALQNTELNSLVNTIPHYISTPSLCSEIRFSFKLKVLYKFNEFWYYIRVQSESRTMMWMQAEYTVKLTTTTTTVPRASFPANMVIWYGWVSFSTHYITSRELSIRTPQKHFRVKCVCVPSAWINTFDYTEWRNIHIGLECWNSNSAVDDVIVP